MVPGGILPGEASGPIPSFFAYPLLPRHIRAVEAVFSHPGGNGDGPYAARLFANRVVRAAVARAAGRPERFVYSKGRGGSCPRFFPQYRREVFSG